MWTAETERPTACHCVDLGPGRQVVEQKEKVKVKRDEDGRMELNVERRRGESRTGKREVATKEDTKKENAEEKTEMQPSNGKVAGG